MAQTESHREQVRMGRRPYEAPQIARVDLRADEVMVVGCKSLKSQGTMASGKPGCVPATCSSVGKS